ncbi:Ada metal-binding domain-containing protein [Pontibacterium sinense]|nr:Ada metal-binding domain-containing protein [Pontibacterium sinense]
MREAVKKRDASMDGLFFYGVVTTGIVCKPSCSSRSAKPENLRFFADMEAASIVGFRPCKRCQPA